jgi:hypothetical protein
MNKKLSNNAHKKWLKKVIEVFVNGDPDLASSSCACCEKKRALYKQLKEFGLVK